MSIKVTVISAFQKPEEHFFDDWGNAEEFALAMREQQYKTTVEELSPEYVQTGGGWAARV